MTTGAVQAVTSGLDRLMEHLEESNKRRGWAPLANAQRLATENEEAWDARLKEEERPYYEADVHDRAYWHSVLDGKIAPETFEELMAGIEKK